MEIDLRKVIAYNKNCLQNKTLLGNILADMYPDQKGDRTVLLIVYETGILREIARNKTVTEWQYKSFIQKLMTDYRMQEDAAIQGLNAWINLFLGEGYSDRFVCKKEKEYVDNSQRVIGNIDDYELTMLSDTTAEIKKYTGPDDEEIIIPNEINGIKIVGIGERAFYSYYHHDLTRIVISEGIKYIRDAAFLKREYLESVILPSSLIELGSDHPVRDGAFQGCISLSDITIPGTVKIIGDNTFLCCTNLKSVRLGNGVSEIGYQAFRNCTSLTEITMPTTIEKIESYAFSNCTNLRFVDLKEGLAEIGHCAFKDCENLRVIEVPKTVSTLYSYTFANCVNLCSVKLNEGLTEIGHCAFEDCESLREIRTPNTLKEIGIRAFCGCKALTSLELNDGLTEIGEYAFKDCINLPMRAMEMPRTVEHLPSTAFSGCRKNGASLSEIAEFAEIFLRNNRLV